MREAGVVAMEDSLGLPRRVGPSLWAWVETHAGRRRLVLAVVGLRGARQEDRANAARDCACALLERHRGRDEVALVLAKVGAVVLEDWRVDAAGVVGDSPDVTGRR